MEEFLKKVYRYLLKIKSRIVYGRPVLVTMYHRVSDVVEDNLQHLTVDTVNFEKQLLYFKNEYQILRLTDDWKSLKKTGLVITFDDGYADNILNALPLLEKHNIPATIFVTTLNTNTKKEFWWDRFSFDYSYCKDLFYIPGIKKKVSKTTHSYRYVAELIHNIPNELKEDWFVNFEKLNSIPFVHQDAFRSLTNVELKRLSQHPLIDIGFHCHNHYSLGGMTYEEQKHEISISIEILNALTSKTIRYLAVPHGSKNDDTFKVMEEIGLLGMLLANNNYSNHNNKSAKIINRILIPNIEGKILISYLGKYDFKLW